MNGLKLRELPICVDCFVGQYNSDKFLHFLSHVHADHIVGLKRNVSYKVYCSAVSAALIKQKVDISIDSIVILNEFQPYILHHQELIISVTLIPANHCPGSSMFIFKSKSCRILYTGDFRFDDELSNIGMPFWGPTTDPINTLYLDNTYCEPACTFSSRESNIEDIIKICNDHESFKIYIGINWVGHERLLLSVAKSLNENIVVSEAQFKVFEILKLENVFTTDRNLGRIYAIPSHSLSNKFLGTVRKNNENIIGILPTARMCHSKFKTRHKEGIFTIEYSNHSCYSEIVKFVKQVSPQRIYPIVQGKQNDNSIGNKIRADMSQFNAFLRKSTCPTDCSSSAEKRTRLSPIDNLKVIKMPPKKRFKHKKVAKPNGVVFEES